MAKTIGGTDGQHLKPDSHPFRASGKAVHTIRPPLASTVGVGPKPGGGGNLISANAQMKKKRPMNGPGDAA